MQPSIQKHYVIISHSADLSFRVFGKNKKELFINAAFSLIDIMFGKIELSSGSKQIQKKEIILRSADLETLFVDWLREIHSLAVIENMVPTKIESFEIKKTNLVAKIIISENRQIPQTEIKAVTYNDIKIEISENECMATIVCDV